MEGYQINIIEMRFISRHVQNLLNNRKHNRQKQRNKLVTTVQFTNNDYEFLTFTGPYSKF